MCNKCDYYKDKNKDYNYCPICGDKLRSAAFIPVASVKRPNAVYNREVIFDDNKIRGVEKYE